jgi:acyl transferase domain-containing protein
MFTNCGSFWRRVSTQLLRWLKSLLVFSDPELTSLRCKIPEHRFKVSDYDDPKHAKPGRTMKACTGNFMDGVDEFDHNFFRISPREAKSMDPQQRILLQTAYEALENCGYVPNDTASFQQQTFGCYIGSATHDYLQNLRDDIDVYYSTGEIFSFYLSES